MSDFDYDEAEALAPYEPEGAELGPDELDDEGNERGADPLEGGTSMNPIEKLHEWLTAHGISPKVADPLIAAVIGILAVWIESGVFDAGELRIAAAAALWALVGGIAPPAAKVRQDEVEAIAHRKNPDLKR